jgi:hypothetical protein
MLKPTQDRKTMKSKLTAKLVGGPNDGQVWQIDEACSRIEIDFVAQQRNGNWKKTSTAKYKLKSSGTPREFEFLG